MFNCGGIRSHFRAVRCILQQTCYIQVFSGSHIVQQWQDGSTFGAVIESLRSIQPSFVWSPAFRLQTNCLRSRIALTPNKRELRTVCDHVATLADAWLNTVFMWSNSSASVGTSRMNVLYPREIRSFPPDTGKRLCNSRGVTPLFRTDWPSRTRCRIPVEY